MRPRLDAPPPREHPQGRPGRPEGDQLPSRSITRSQEGASATVSRPRGRPEGQSSRQRDRRFIAAHPNATVVAVGEGLEPQLWRIDNDRIRRVSRWISRTRPHWAGSSPPPTSDQLIAASALDTAAWATRRRGRSRRRASHVPPTATLSTRALRHAARDRALQTSSPNASQNTAHKLRKGSYQAPA